MATLLAGLKVPTDHCPVLNSRPDPVEGVNRPDVTPSTALLRLSQIRKNKVLRAFRLLACTSGEVEIGRSGSQ
jgi:hypothetical protein